MKDQEIKTAVRNRYAAIAEQGSSCCGSAGSKRIGYSEADLTSAPEGANLGLGCGNPVALAFLKKGEVVLDLGAGPGFDCFLAAQKVGKNGRVIGVDMTPEMMDRARKNASKGGYENVEFRLGEIEHLPVADTSVDAVISNCVVNLAPDKSQVFMEAFRVLRPGGRMMISDIVLLKELPEFIRNSILAYVGCVAGALLKDEYITAIQRAGFQNVRIVDETPFPMDDMVDDPPAIATVENVKISPEEAREIARSIVSIKVHGIKPSAGKS